MTDRLHYQPLFREMSPREVCDRLLRMENFHMKGSGMLVENVNSTQKGD